MRFHVGCGSVYLRDYVNIDVPADHIFRANERRDLVARFIADESDYYGRHKEKGPDTWRKGPITQETVCDLYNDWGRLPARNGTVAEILSRQSFEHLDRAEASKALDESYRVLKVGGILRIDVPDPDETLRLYRETGDPFYLRHLYGPRLDGFGSHTLYNRQMLRSVVEERRFKFQFEEPNIHDKYPAFCLRWEKW